MLQITEGSCNSEPLIRFLDDLHEHVADANITMIKGQPVLAQVQGHEGLGRHPA